MQWGGVKNGGGPGAKAPENFLGSSPLELRETPILNIEILPFEYRDTPNLDKKPQIEIILVYEKP